MQPELTAEDRAHLKTLSICWYVYGGLTLLGGLCGGLYALFGVIALAAGASQNDEEATVMGGVFLVVGIFVLLLVIPLGIFCFLAGKGLAMCRRKVLIYVMAALACTNIPLGLILGIFTFIVMGRPSVRAAFDQNAMGMPLQQADY